MTRVENLREVWAEEARDFTPWLAEDANLKLLGEALGLDLVLEERESPVGSFNADLFAKEEGSDNKVIIENQLGSTDHDHLGKLITYASGKDANVVVWIVKRARDEHRQAIEWLNQKTDSSIGFFLVEIELWRIDTSRIAPKFNIVERPNEWTRGIKAEENLTPGKRMQQEFWMAFRESAQDDPAFMTAFRSLQKAQPQHWYTLRIGSSVCHLNLLVNTVKKLIGAELYISGDKDFYRLLQSDKVNIEQEAGTKLEWKEASKDCRIIMTSKGDINKRTSWGEYHDWMRTTLITLSKVFKKRLP